VLSIEPRLKSGPAWQPARQIVNFKFPDINFMTPPMDDTVHFHHALSHGCGAESMRLGYLRRHCDKTDKTAPCAVKRVDFWQVQQFCSFAPLTGDRDEQVILLIESQDGPDRGQFAAPGQPHRPSRDCRAGSAVHPRIRASRRGRTGLVSAPTPYFPGVGAFAQRNGVFGTPLLASTPGGGRSRDDGASHHGPSGEHGGPC